ncbi:hypothetical protein BDQ17DRAFT_1384965 [Cyathus striatus]|nr:hypothetical protein BDQ17DRAFT_1384965 [Cyathus striatus]
MPTFGITAAQIVGLFMETVFYGIFLVTFFHAYMRWKEINKMMTAAALLMFFFGTMDVALGLRHNLEAFVYNAGVVNVMKIADYDAQTFVGDGILTLAGYNISRPFVDWHSRFVLCSILTIYIEATLGTGVLNQKQLKPFITGQLTLTLAMNILTTGLIVYRIWSIQLSTAAIQLTQSSAFHPYSRVLRTLIECGAIYTLSVLILFACYLASNNAQLGVSDSIVQIIILTGSHPIIRVGRGTAVKPENSSGTSGPVHRYLYNEWATRDSRAYPLHQVKIKTVTSVSRDGDDGILDGSDGKDEARLDRYSHRGDADDERLPVPKPQDNWESSAV